MPRTVLRCVCEWQVDAVLDWHARHSSKFCQWLLHSVFSQAGLQAPTGEPKLIESFVHKNSGHGEAWGENDVRMEFALDRTRVTLLCETKIDASFTERQPERYRLRCEQLLCSKSRHIALSVLIAPWNYMNRCGSDQFHARLCMEDLERVLASEARTRTLEDILAQHAALIAQACNYEYVQSRDPIAGPFWDHYREYVRLFFPLLRIKTRTGGSVRSKDVYFEGKITGWQVKHRLDPKDSRVAIELLGWSGMMQCVREAFQGLLPHGMMIIAPPSGRTRGGQPRSIQISSAVPPVNTMLTFDSQIDSVRAGLETVEATLQWTRDSSTIIEALVHQHRK